MRREASAGLGDLLAVVPLSEQWKGRLHTMMSGDDRFYHDVGHLVLLFDRHLRFAREAGFDGPSETRMIASAIAFHDCVCESGRGDNEERSAQVWLEASAHADVDAQERAWVADTIRATGDHLGHSLLASPHAGSGSLEALRCWMLDLDLTPLGETKDVFDRNARLLRAEAPQMDDPVFEARRLHVLRRFADAPIIYRTPVIADHFDTPARSNLARHLSGSFLGR